MEQAAVRALPERQETVELDASKPLGIGLHVDGNTGLLYGVSRVDPGGQGEVAGVRVGWEIVAVGEVGVTTFAELEDAINAVNEKAAGESERAVGQGGEVCEQVGAQYEAKLGEIEGEIEGDVAPRDSARLRAARRHAPGAAARADTPAGHTRGDSLTLGRPEAGC